MATLMKQALVMGNEAYVENPIQKCVNDATDMSRSLHSIGFQVQPAMNRRSKSMHAITHRFVQSIQPGSIVTFYFSGHGFQYNGINYLVPVDDDNLYIENLDSVALNVQKLISSMHSRRPRLTILILDVCRSDPTSTTQDGKRFRKRGLLGTKDGLAPMVAPPATIIAYACAENEYSSTLSMNGRNSLYTYHLLRYIATPNTDIDLVLRKVAADVQKDPLNLLNQVPFRYSSCNEIICLVDYGGINAPMLPIGWQSEPSFQPYQNQYVKVPAMGHFYPYINSSQYRYLMPHNYRTVQKKSLSNTIRRPMTHSFPYLWQFYPRW